jgi:hypothetical protein
MMEGHPPSISSPVCLSAFSALLLFYMILHTWSEPWNIPRGGHGSTRLHTTSQLQSQSRSQSVQLNQLGRVVVKTTL